jgi:2-oxoacid:acceptor oxidoreductase gamma subunit (pyruvate/2-ketoisovalerate family)
MREFRLHGRGGQGVQTAGHALALALFLAGHPVQAFASYGGERRGTPVTAFVRVGDRPLRVRCDVEHPEAVVAFEPSFVLEGTALAGAVPGGWVLIRTAMAPEAFREWAPGLRVATVDALAVARRHGLGRHVNTALLGAFARVVPGLDADLLAEAVARTVPPAAREANLAALREGYRSVRVGA